MTFNLPANRRAVAWYDEAMITIGSDREIDINATPEVNDKKSARSTPASQTIVVRAIVDIIPSLYALDSTRPLFVDKLMA